MKLSIVTDAAVSLVTGRGAYAFYIGCRDYKVLKAGILKVKPDNVVAAELCSIVNALHCFNSCQLQKVKSVVIYSDSLTALALLSGIIKPNTQQTIKALNEAFRLIIKSGKPFSYKHVKSHTGGADKLSVINDWCDKQAVLYRKKADSIGL